MKNAELREERAKNWAFKDLAIWLAALTLYYAFAVFTGTRGMDNFAYIFGDFTPILKSLIALALPYWSNPFVLILAALILWRLGWSGIIHLTRLIAAFFAAYFLLRWGIQLLAIYPVSVSGSEVAMGLAALAWYVLSSGAVSLSTFQDLRERLGAD